MTKLWLPAALFLTVVTSGITAGAQQEFNMVGSDALEHFTSELIDSNCNGGFTYSGVLAPYLNSVGGGSGYAPSAMLAQLTAQHDGQLASPMSRPLTAQECLNAFAIAPAVAPQGIVIGLDGIVIVGDSTNSQTCGGGHTTGQSPGPNAVGYASGPQYSALAGPGGSFPYWGGTYTLGGGSAQPTPWKDLLRLLYTGLRNSDPNPASSAASLSGNCKSPERQALTDSYSLLFRNGCTAGNCAELRHAFRLGDRLGTTDIFLSLIGAPSNVVATDGRVTKTAFCNGLENEDMDPIRRTCTDDEQVCEADGSLGLVLPIVVPSLAQFKGSNGLLPNSSETDISVLYNAAGEPYGSELGDLARFGKIRIVPGPNCASAPSNLAPNPAQELDPTKPDWNPGTPAVVGWNLPVGYRFPNSPRCDCRYPTSGDYLSIRTASGAFVPGTENNSFKWNERSGGCPVVYRGGGSTGANEPPVRFGLLNGQDNNGDNSPGYWGSTYVSGSKRICCNIGGRNWIMDPRQMNLQVRDPSPSGSFPGTAAPGGLLGGNTNPVSTTAFYRIHASTRGRNVVPNRNTQVLTPAAPINAVLCQEPDATRAIASLVQLGSTCSIGYAAREAVASANAGVSAEAFALTIANPSGGAPLSIGPTVPDIQKLVDANVAVRAVAYPLSRRLYYNTFIGFGNAHGAGHLNFVEGPVFYDRGHAQFYFGHCLANAERSNSTLQAAGFVGLPGGPKLCLDMCGANSSCNTLTNINLNSPNLQ